MNPEEYLQPLPTELLIAMAKGEVDAKAVAAQLVAGRGLNEEGKWVGFNKAANIWTSSLKPMLP